MKLHKHISRFKFRRSVSKWAEKRIRWALSLKPGDIINDCTALNVVIRKIRPNIVSFNNGWYIYNVHFDTEPFGAGCSLLNCGVEPALPRDFLEKQNLQYINEWMACDKKTRELYFKRLAVIEAGGHFLDERGVLLPEFGRE